LTTSTPRPGRCSGGQVSPADREHLRAWLARFAGVEDAAFAVEGCTGWRYVADLGPGWHQRKADTDRRTRSLLSQLRALHPEADITITPAA
jgi:hypothetical protein